MHFKEIPRFKPRKNFLAKVAIINHILRYEKCSLTAIPLNLLTTILYFISITQCLIFQSNYFYSQKFKILVIRGPIHKAFFFITYK
jgi:hypothetical protein